ncbi:MAG: hypothetical protein K2W94_08680 [Alphaproteobacteria bacterium]|nr:hypothetical protein [Alphaproteobacteria bacterium]
MSNYDYYKETKKLIALLTQDGAEEYADGLLDAMSGSIIGTEIFMDLKWNIKNILKLDYLSKETRKHARQLHAELNKALRACD